MIGLAALLACGCRDADAPPRGAEPAVPEGLGAGEPAAVPEDADAAIEAILARCHGPRRGGFDRALLELRTAAAGPADTVLLAAPASLRVSAADGATRVVDGARGFAFGGADAATRALDVAELRELERLRDVLALVALQPLEQRSAARRVAADRIALETPSGTAELTHDGDAPRRLVRGDLDVEFLEFHVTPRTRVPLQVAIGGLGVRHVRFLDTDVDFPAGTFAPPAERDRPPVDVAGAPGTTPPRVVAEPAVDWLLVPDAGPWPDRLDALFAAAARLGDAGYTGAGDPVLLRLDDADWFALPYVAAAERPDPVPLGAGERVVARPATRLAVLELPEGGFEARVAAGRGMLDAWCAARGHTVDGALEIAVNVAGPDPRDDPRAVDRMLVTLRYRLADGR